jgi:hypothetical protein
MLDSNLNEAELLRSDMVAFAARILHRVSFMVRLAQLAGPIARSSGGITLDGK